MWWHDAWASRLTEWWTEAGIKAAVARACKIPSRVQGAGSCGTYDVPVRAWDWVSDRHAWRHNKGRDGLSPACDIEWKWVPGDRGGRGGGR